jgi:DNA methylase
MALQQRNQTRSKSLKVFLSSAKNSREHRTKIKSITVAFPPHPTVKPTAMLEDALLDLTNRGDIVVDPFLGSRSTLVAADNTGRVCRGVELDPLYVDVIMRRYEAATCKLAVLIETGEAFGILAARRKGKQRRSRAGSSLRRAFGTRPCRTRATAPSSARMPALRRSEVRIPSAPPGSPRVPTPDCLPQGQRQRWVQRKV